MNQTSRLTPTLAVVAKSSGLPAIVNSRDLLRGGQELLILHEGQVYILRQTKERKLILNK